MLKIRLRRMGAIRQPHYRIVVADSRSPRDGRFLESLGHYNPRTDPATIQVDVAKYEEWKSKGAQPTGAVARLVRQFNRTTRQADSSVEAAQPASRRTRTASGKGVSKPQPVAEAAAPEAAEAEATPEAEAAVEETIAAETPAESATEEPSADVEEASTEAAEAPAEEENA
jgi:small subunit ribosomal protein S16